MISVESKRKVVICENPTFTLVLLTEHQQYPRNINKVLYDLLLIGQHIHPSIYTSSVLLNYELQLLYQSSILCINKIFLWVNKFNHSDRDQSLFFS